MRILMLYRDSYDGLFAAAAICSGYSNDTCIDCIRWDKDKYLADEQILNKEGYDILYIIGVDLTSRMVMQLYNQSKYEKIIIINNSVFSCYMLEMLKENKQALYGEVFPDDDKRKILLRIKPRKFLCRLAWTLESRNAIPTALRYIEDVMNRKITHKDEIPFILGLLNTDEYNSPNSIEWRKLLRPKTNFTQNPKEKDLVGGRNELISYGKTIMKKEDIKIEDLESLF